MPDEPRLIREPAVITPRLRQRLAEKERARQQRLALEAEALAKEIRRVETAMARRKKPSISVATVSAGRPGSKRRH